MRAICGAMLALTVCLAGASWASAAPLLAAVDGDVWRVDDATREMEPAWRLHLGDDLLGGFAPAPDGAALAYVVTPQPRGRTQLRVATQGGTRTIFTGDLYSGPTWTPDGQRIVYV